MPVPFVFLTLGKLNRLLPLVNEFDLLSELQRMRWFFLCFMTQQTEELQTLNYFTMYVKSLAREKQGIQ